MNIYELSRKWFDFCFENPEMVKPNHTALYFFSIEHCNRLGWKEKFGLPTSMTMEAIGIKSYNTYIKTLNQIVDYGFIILIEKSKNQYSSNIIALSKFNKASNKALDKALMKHASTHCCITKESIDSINKQLHNNTILQVNKYTREMCDYLNNNVELVFLKKNNISDIKVNFEEVEEIPNFETLLNPNDKFLNEVCEYFSQTTEGLKMKVYNFFVAKIKSGNYDEFKKQTEAYMVYKTKSNEIIHKWQNYLTEWENEDWINKKPVQKNKQETKTLVSNRG